MPSFDHHFNTTSSILTRCLSPLGRPWIKVVHGILSSPNPLLPAEDGMLLQIVLAKSAREASNAWPSLLEGQFEANAHELDEMQKKLTLERFQREVRWAGSSPGSA